MLKLSCQWNKIEMVKVRNYLGNSLKIITEPSVIADSLLSNIDCTEELKDEYKDDLYMLLNNLIEAKCSLDALIDRVTGEELDDLTKNNCSLTLYTDIEKYSSLNTFTSTIVKYAIKCKDIWKDSVIKTLYNAEKHNDAFITALIWIDKIENLKNDFLETSNLITNQN